MHMPTTDAIRLVHHYHCCGFVLYLVSYCCSPSYRRAHQQLNQVVHVLEAVQRPNKPSIQQVAGDDAYHHPELVLRLESIAAKDPCGAGNRLELRPHMHMHLQPDSL